MFESAAGSQVEQIQSHSAEQQQPSAFHNELSQIDRENMDMNRVHQLRDKVDKQGAPLSGSEAWEFSSKNLFPGDPLGQELVLKMFQRIELTPKEQGELQGRFEFRRNPRGQELVQKSYVDTMTAAEQQELQVLRQRKYENGNVKVANPAPVGDRVQMMNSDNLDNSSNDQYLLKASQEKYPDNPRARDLYLRDLTDGKLTAEERAELAQIDAPMLYPLDARAQELHVRAVTQPFDQDEYNELKIRQSYVGGSEELIQLSLAEQKRSLTDSELTRRSELFAEDAARKEFPDDFRMQDLIIRDNKGRLSRGERLELTTGRARQNASQMYDSYAEQQEYIDRQVQNFNEAFDRDEKQKQPEPNSKDPLNPFKPH